MKLDQSYSRETLIQIAFELDKEFQKDIRSFAFHSNIFVNAHYIGRLETVSTDVIEIEVFGKVKDRVAISKEAFKLLKSIASPHAVIVFFSKSETRRWRLSLLRTEYDISDGKIVTNQSNPRRFSYLLGEGAKVNTPMKFLITKGQLLDFEDLKERFSMEVVNKDFYEKIALLFTKLIGGRRKVGNKSIDFNGLLKIKGDSNTSLEHQEFGVRLLGRLLFVWFLKEKKSPDKIPLISNEILSLNAIKKSDDYYCDVLEILFFEVLNKRINKRKPNLNQTVYRWIPYLNGGLFSPHSSDYYDFDDKNKQISIPNDWFVDLFEVFETYNFTVDENTSFDVELSIDPEMLGRIFENLLAEINPDTGESARKATGSFYTPRHIVEYMVNQSIKSYLKTKTKLKIGQIDYITSDNFGFDDEMIFSETEKRSLIKALKKVKILDPACGSGAFPIGILQRLVHIASVIDPNADIWNEEDLKKLTPEYRKSIIETYSKSGFGYLRKLQIIRESIFGVDVQPIATEISRLRCFLTLIVDETVEDDQENRGIKALPNLDFKFVTANSLNRLEVKDKSIKNQTVSMLSDEDILIEKLQRIREDYFLTTAENRDEIQKSFLKKQKEMQGYVSGANETLKTDKFQKLMDWNPFSEDASEWLDTEWMFGVSNFDIVIQNPPYVSTKSISPEDKTMLKANYGYVDDLYNHFIVRGLEFLEPYGVQTVISSDTYFTTETKKQLRDRILAHKIESIISLGYNVFETAFVSTAIILVNKMLQLNSNLKFIDAKDETDILSAPNFFVDQKIYTETINKAIFIPNERNLSIHYKLAKYWTLLNKQYSDVISTSRNITKYKHIINDHIKLIKAENYTLIGLVTDGGVGLQTGNNGKFVGVKDGTKEAERIRQTRSVKLNEVNRKFNQTYKLPTDEQNVWKLFDNLKESYGRDIFGQGYLFRIVDNQLIADVKKLSDDEKKHGIDSESSYFVAYDKGDKDGNRWYLKNSYVIAWSKKNVAELKRNAGKKGFGSSRFQNPQFYFKEGFCYSDIKTHYIKARIKPPSIHDVKSMSLFSETSKVPNYYLITLLNSQLAADIVSSFINNTQTFQINDCRFLPIPIPSQSQLNECKIIFDKALEIQKSYFKDKLVKSERDNLMKSIQYDVDAFTLKIYDL